MRIILTHEQADFDAIASLLAAYLLDDSAIPVLPRRINRNVRAFVTIYGIELPFIEANDLINEPIDQVTLVDTQSMVSLKGMRPSMKVMVIDHHPRKENLAEDWLVQIPETGANTTYLVELLRETNGNLRPIHATLLLLGIYEDTGSLMYSRSTPRDLRAAAYLLESGANLQIAGDFLNHPLSADQQKLYDELRTGAENLTIHGHQIILASGDSTGMDEELSSIAHKLRDLLDPDGLILVVKTNNGIQLIARSTSDQIDVAEILSHFGGGGHERAAASLIRDEELDEVVNRLKLVLAEVVRPAVTVSQIMSRGPQLLSPDTLVKEADERMRRFGYEGYPVVADEETEKGIQKKIVGLLTRRAVDRALGHNYNVPISNIMSTGRVSVAPDDSIELLQQRMIDSNWGQIPVVDPKNNEIVGIVTRTDLIKTLSLEQQPNNRFQLSAKLEEALDHERIELINAISQAAFERHYALYIVGGFVRDLILEQPSQDFDLVVEGEAIQLAQSLAKKWGGRVTSHGQFGTAKWHLANSRFHNLSGENPIEAVDLVSARTEFYTHPTALPTVERGSIKLDLHRRDFTINTLALRIDGRHYGELHDYWGGLNDLRMGIVRVLHSFSFVDDPTRILRAVRFEQRFKFRIEDRTLELLLDARPLIGRLSGDRIRHELNHIFSEPDTAAILDRLDKIGLLGEIHPHLTWDEWIKEKIIQLDINTSTPDWGLPEKKKPGDLRVMLIYFLLLIRLEPEQAKKVTKRLKLPAKLAGQIQQACDLWMKIPKLKEMKPSEFVNAVEDVSELTLYALYQACDDETLKDRILQYNRQWQYITPRIDGKDLRELGLAPGPIYKEILNRLRNAWLDETIHSQAEEAEMLADLLDHHKRSLIIS